MRNLKLDKKKYEYIFIASLFCLQAFFWIGLINDYSGNQANVFFAKAGNYLADYINVAKYSADKNPYFDITNGSGEHAYLPLTYILFWILSKLSNFKNVSAFEAGYSTLSLTEINLFIIFMTLIFFLYYGMQLRKL